jgi:hypothetical protein
MEAAHIFSNTPSFGYKGMNEVPMLAQSTFCGVLTWRDRIGAHVALEGNKAHCVEWCYDCNCGNRIKTSQTVSSGA